MSGFIRPGARAWLRRWAEPLVALAVAALGARVLWRARVLDSWFLLAIGGAILLGGLAAAWVGYRRTLFSGPGQGPGLVEVDERQISYMTAAGGGAIDLGAITRLEICNSPKTGPFWVLRQQDGPSLFIPIDSLGAEKLFDALLALPGIDAARLIAARQQPPADCDIIWQRPRGTRALQ